MTNKWTQTNKDDCFLQNSQMLKECVEGYLQMYDEARWDDETLKELFWSEMDDIFGQMLLLGEDHPSFCRVTPWHILHHQQSSLCPLQLEFIIPTRRVPDY